LGDLENMILTIGYIKSQRIPGNTANKAVLATKEKQCQTLLDQIDSSTQELEKASREKYQSGQAKIIRNMMKIIRIKGKKANSST
jgi:hypothetical protein